MLVLTQARHISGHRLWLQFSDGVEGEVDLASELNGTVFAPPQAVDEFRRVQLDPELRTVVWPNGADFAPEFLYELVRRVAA